MSLRQKLTKPFVVEPADPANHTHTVVFLHRFPETTKDDELPARVLSSKRTSRNHKTLGEQFPTVRWVFPFAKLGARPYGNLTAEDKADVGLANSASPYITQILLQEAQRLQEDDVPEGLEKVVLGGQGETAVAGHEAMLSFPEIPAALRNKPEVEESQRAQEEKEVNEIAEFLQSTFHSANWSHPTAHPRLAGYVGMHAENSEVTRDFTTYRSATLKGASSSSSSASAGPTPSRSINTSILLNTPHRFIHGGYKVHNAGKWDGRRIDDFAKFLAEDLGVYRVPDDALLPATEMKKPSPANEKHQAELNEREKIPRPAGSRKEGQCRPRQDDQVAHRGR